MYYGLPGARMLAPGVSERGSGGNTAYTATLDEAAAKAAVKAVLDTTAVAKKAAKAVGDSMASSTAAEAFRRKVATLMSEPWRTTLALLPRHTQCQVVVSAFKQLLAARTSLGVVVALPALETARLVNAQTPRSVKDADSWYRALAVDAPSLEGAVPEGDARARRTWAEDVAMLVAALPSGFPPSAHMAGLLQRARGNPSAAPAVLIDLQSYMAGLPNRRRRSSRRRRSPYYAHM